MEWLDSFWSTYSTFVLATGTNVLLALSIYVTLACGLLSVANAGFMAIGAYSAVLLSLRTGTPLPIALIVGAVAAAMVALLIGVPTLRLSGVYLAMATLAFGEVVRILILNAENVTGGALGLNGIPQLVGLFDVVFSVTVALYVFLRLAQSRVGRTITAISQDEIATELMGLNVRAYKLVCFVVGAALAGLAGGAFRTGSTVLFGLGGRCQQEFQRIAGIERVLVLAQRHVVGRRRDVEAGRQPRIQ